MNRLFLLYDDDIYNSHSKQRKKQLKKQNSH